MKSDQQQKAGGKVKEIPDSQMPHQNKRENLYEQAGKKDQGSGPMDKGYSKESM